MKTVLKVLSVCVVAFILAGCQQSGGAGEKGGSGANMDMQDAADRVDSMLDATLAAVRPAVQWAHGGTVKGSCALTRNRTVTTIISEERRGNFLGIVENFWKKNGYEVTSVNKSKGSPAVFVESPDGFGLSLIFGGAGQATFEGSTPCVQKSEVLPATAEPNGPSYEGVEIPRPNVRSDFWSADTPLPAPSSSATA